MESSNAQSSPPSAPAKKSKTGMYAIIGVIVIIIIAVVALYYAGYLGGSAATVNVNIVDDGTCSNGSSACNFSPGTTSTTTGKTLTWKNTGSLPHTITWFSNSTGTPIPSSSNQLSNGQTYQATFSGAGTYYYYCSVHNWMHGTVTVS